MEQKPEQHLKIGRLGENLVVKHLENLGFKILNRNYWKPCGEIDIVVSKRNCTHFVEVKTVTRSIGGVNRETLDEYEPADNMHSWKQKRLARVIQVYLREKGIGEDSDWQVDLFSVYIDRDGKLLKIDCLEDVILE